MTTNLAPTGVIRLKRGTAKAHVIADRLATLQPSPVNLPSAPVTPTPIIDLDEHRLAKVRSQPLQARIDKLTDKSAGMFGVWKWKGSRSQANGYPQISYNCPFTGKYCTKAVTRALMEMKLGRKLERHEFVLHDRGVPKDDVNPAHLRIGTHRENVEDAHAEGRIGRRGKLDVKAILKIVELRHKHHVDVSAIAHRYGVCNRTINDICKGKSHAKITGIQDTKDRKPGRPFKKHLQVETKPKRGQPSAPRVLEAVS